MNVIQIVKEIRGIFNSENVYDRIKAKRSQNFELESPIIRFRIHEETKTNRKLKKKMANLARKY